MRISIGKGIGKYVWLAVAAAAFSWGVTSFIDANDFAPGGVSGLCIVLNRIIPLEIGTLFLILNIPVLLLGFWKFGGKLILSTVYTILLISVFSNLLERMQPGTTDPVLGALTGGALVAVGMGMALRAGSTTGGMDIIVKVLRLKLPYLKTGSIFLLADAVVIGLGGMVFGSLEAVLYSVLAEVVTSRLLDLILYGTDGAKLVYVISCYPEQIAQRILSELHSGVTYLNGKGGYQKEDKKIILCVIRKQNMHQLEEIVKTEDEQAFMIVSGASEIYGEGYKSLFVEKL